MVLQQDANFGDATEGKSSSFDLHAAIAQLLSDSRCSSIELPSGMTPAERKLARSIADSHPELRSESYGFGAERRLHLFKKSATTCIRVKNTFIDGWDSPDSLEEDAEPIIIRSMPDKLEKLLMRDPFMCAGHAINGILELPPLVPQAMPHPTGTHDIQSDDCDDTSTLSGSDVSHMTSESLVFSPASGTCSSRISPASGTVSESRSERRMERRDHNNPASPPGVFASPPPPGVFRFPVGTRVILRGLVKAPAFNGRVGTVHSLNEEAGRYNVLLVSPNSEPQWAKVKYENLRPANCARHRNSSAAA
jgi:hypothetical protein